VVGGGLAAHSALAWPGSWGTATTVPRSTAMGMDTGGVLATAHGAHCCHPYHAAADCLLPNNTPHPSGRPLAPHAHAPCRPSSPTTPRSRTLWPPSLRCVLPPRARLMMRGCSTRTERTCWHPRMPTPSPSAAPQTRCVCVCMLVCVCVRVLSHFLAPVAGVKDGRSRRTGAGVGRSR